MMTRTRVRLFLFLLIDVTLWSHAQGETCQSKVFPNQRGNQNHWSGYMNFRNPAECINFCCTSSSCVAVDYDTVNSGCYIFSTPTELTMDASYSYYKVDRVPTPTMPTAAEPAESNGSGWPGTCPMLLQFRRAVQAPILTLQLSPASCRSLCLYTRDCSAVSLLDGSCHLLTDPLVWDSGNLQSWSKSCTRSQCCMAREELSSSGTTLASFKPSAPGCQTVCQLVSHCWYVHFAPESRTCLLYGESGTEPWEEGEQMFLKSCQTGPSYDDIMLISDCTDGGASVSTIGLLLTECPSQKTHSQLSTNCPDIFSFYQNPVCITFTTPATTTTITTTNTTSTTTSYSTTLTSTVDVTKTITAIKTTTITSTTPNPTTTSTTTTTLASTTTSATTTTTSSFTTTATTKLVSSEKSPETSSSTSSSSSSSSTPDATTTPTTEFSSPLVTEVLYAEQTQMDAGIHTASTGVVAAAVTSATLLIGFGITLAALLLHGAKRKRRQRQRYVPRTASSPPDLFTVSDKPSVTATNYTIYRGYNHFSVSTEDISIKQLPERPSGPHHHHHAHKHQHQHHQHPSSRVQPISKMDFIEIKSLRPV